MVVGSRSARFSAAGLKSAGSIRLLTNGARSVICRPPLHAGEANAVKSPASIAAVGTYAMLLGRHLTQDRCPGSRRRRTACRGRSGRRACRRTGCASGRRPSACRRGRIAAKGSGALNRWSRRNSKALPWKRLVPDLVTALTDAPECMPFCAERPLVATGTPAARRGTAAAGSALLCGLLCIAPSSV